MTSRDLEYIWNRLAAPCNDALEAYGRLQKVGYGIEAGELMVAMQTFTDECRRIRQQVSRRNAGQPMDDVNTITNQLYRAVANIVGEAKLPPGEYKLTVLDDSINIEGEVEAP